MNIYDYRTIPPEESAYHARTVNVTTYGDDDVPEVDLPQDKKPSDPESSDFGAVPAKDSSFGEEPEDNGKNKIIP